MRSSNNTRSANLTQLIKTTREIPLIVLRLTYLSEVHASSRSLRGSFRCTITTEILLYTSILLGCVPFLKTFIQHLSPGWSTGRIRASDIALHPTNDKSKSVISKRSFRAVNSLDLAEAGAVGASVPPSGPKRTSSDGSRTMMIHQTQDVSVEREHTIDLNLCTDYHHFRTKLQRLQATKVS